MIPYGYILILDSQGVLSLKGIVEENPQYQGYNLQGIATEE